MLRNFRRSVMLFFLVSFAIHTASIIVLQLRPTAKPPQKKDQPIEIAILTPPPPPPELTPDKQRQIVEQQEKAMNEETPKDNYFLSRNNQVVKQQTQARFHGKFQNAEGKFKGESKNKDSKKANNAKQAKAAIEKGQGVKAENLKPKMDLSEMVERGEGSSASQTDDHLEDVATGMETVLNTREFLYYSYYARIKNKIRQYWEPIIKEKITRVIKQGRTLASSSNRVTQIIIILDERGELVKVQIVGESGLADLDDAAVEAFRAAAPFPNPPKGMIEEDGRIRIRWDFILEA